MKKIYIIVFSVISLALMSIKVLAHESILDIEYDVCSGMEAYFNDYNKKWYVFTKASFQEHLSHTTTEIKYYISETSSDGTINWNSTGKTDEEVEEMLDEYIVGMKKWNNAYFYYQNSNGTIEKKKIINIVEGTANDNNLIIYPTIYESVDEELNYGAFTNSIASSRTVIDSVNNVNHYHNSKWYMEINLLYARTALMSRNGAHELGHVLGLGDIDYAENENNQSDWHHHELLMGYDRGTQSDITYRDLAGVAITRGFHTDNDHKWLYDSSNSENGNYKLICSICNGVKYVSDLNSYTYDIYESCNSNHSLSSNNMMAVGCYQNKDYYKCKYCRYVAPFTSNVTQNYQYSEYSTSLHKIINNVIGLNYTMYESHTYNQTHTWVNNTQHRSSCICGKEELQGHAVSSGAFDNGSQTAICLLCGGSASVGFIQNNNKVKISDNGSYILSNGLVVLQDVDVEAYLNNTLIFRDISEDIK